MLFPCTQKRFQKQSSPLRPLSVVWNAAHHLLKFLLLSPISLVIIFSHISFRGVLSDHKAPGVSSGSPTSVQGSKHLDYLQLS